ncbi:hypothetical protein SASPL_155159 [Salvia splendens]|uniref:DUF4378 domain-containing protein n=1 Tax=Salvia splendens TaxID=180675 RepID=A0A8X8W1V9_SALSN|nr:uncharacterized protein LOC121787862 [Salvia splendens]KAG6386266.1 hypothetical protein SASPL_155159 [Salvia splendens]
MDHKHPILHELLQQHQEPFRLKTYLSDNNRSSCSRSHPRNSSPPESRAFLRIPAGTAAALAEAAERIQKHRKSSGGVSLFGSILRILKHRRRGEGNCELKGREIRIPCSCGRLRRDDDDRSASSAMSHFGFSPISGPRTPDFDSPAASPIRRVKQEGVVGEEEEQCSPVCVLDALYEDEEHPNLVGDDEDEYDDLEPAYANIERARKQLLERLERFEKLAALDQVDLEQKLLEASDEEHGIEFEQLLLRRKQRPSSSLKESRMKRAIGGDKSKVVMGHLWRDALDMMMEVEFKTEAGVEETVAELELAIFEELIEQCLCMDPSHSLYPSCNY